MPTLIRYILLQIPGWIILAWLLWWGVASQWMEIWFACLIMVLWLVKDALLYPFARPAYEGSSPPIGAKALIGREALTVTDLSPGGMVRVAGELWTAESADKGHIVKGRQVCIIDSEGLNLKVSHYPAQVIEN